MERKTFVPWLRSVLDGSAILGGRGHRPYSGTGAVVAPVTAEEAREIAVDAYVYAYPLVLMEISRRVMTNVAEVPRLGGSRAPMNQIAHLRAFPDASFTDVVRPNVDTLYSAMWFDVGREPLVIEVPDSGGRYYLLPLLDMWTDVFASPGKRTTGTGPQTFAIVGPAFRGRLPKGVAEIRSPTPIGWLIGRTQCDGEDDIDAARAFQAGLRAVPLGMWGMKGYVPPKGHVDPKVRMNAPPDQVAAMDAASFFALFARVVADTPPHANDYPILQRMERIGLVPGRPFHVASLPLHLRAALQAAPAAGQRRILDAVPRMGTAVNGWRNILTPIGTYGTDYQRRAAIAQAGLGANVVEDAIYPTALTDAAGHAFESSAKYTLHFDRGRIPPANAFWSLTMYDDRQLLAENPRGRYALGSRDPLKLNPDGSLDIHVQRQPPGPGKESNWLPAPQEGGFSLTLRLYWPKTEAFDGTWSPPPVRRVG